MTDENLPKADQHSLLPDTALSDPEFDRLDRAPFAASLSSSIRSLEGNDSFVIGLCGPWGSGKTSVLNFVLSDLESEEDDAPIILRFNPWWFSGREQLLEAFLAQFTATLDMPKRGENAKKAGKLLGTLSAALRPVALIPFIGEAAKVGREAVDALAGASNAYGDAVSRNVFAIREEIDELLTDSPNRIIVVMDDIDRLAAKEIAQLFLILKAVADFPRTVYLLAFDQGVITQAINEQLGVDGKTYLEKIVQLQIDVPPTAQTAIHQMFMEQLNELMRGEEDVTPQQGQYFWNVFHDGIKQFLVTPRAAKKLINMLRFAYPPLRGEVNVVDMIGIACLTTFVPRVITTIATNADQFTGVGPRTALGGQDEYQQRKTFHRAWLDQLPEAERSAVEGIVKRLFPSVNHALEGTGHSGEFETIWQRELRVCSSSHFEKYFRLAIPAGTISENEWKQVEESLEDGAALDQLLASYVGQSGPHGFRSRASELLDRALLFARTALPDQATKLFQSLLRAGDLLVAIRDEDMIGGMVPINNRRRLTWVLHELLERFETQKQREALLVESLKQDVGPHTASELVVSLGFQNGTYGDNADTHDPRYVSIVTKSAVRRIAKQVRKIIRDETQGDKGEQLAKHGDFMKIVINWWWIGGKKEAKEWLREATSSDTFLVATLIQQLSKTRKHGMSDRTAIETEVIDAGFLKNFLKLKECRQRCEQLLQNPPEWLDERGRTALTITVNSIKPSGKPIDHWAERIGRNSDRKQQKKQVERKPGTTENEPTEV
jgi:predicted KAP-like P-loop ATPase